MFNKRYHLRADFDFIEKQSVLTKEQMQELRTNNDEATIESTGSAYQNDDGEVEIELKDVIGYYYNGIGDIMGAFEPNEKQLTEYIQKLHNEEKFQFEPQGM